MINKYEHASLGLSYYNCPYPSSVQNERRKNMLAYFYDRVQPQTPKASKGRQPRAHTCTSHFERATWMVIEIAFGFFDGRGCIVQKSSQSLLGRDSFPANPAF